jgi:hypothetical protein
LSRVIRPESAALTRTKLKQNLAVALRRASDERPENERLDILAFMALALQKVSASADETAAAWEKRGYWLKADRFRMEWDWAQTIGDRLAAALHRGDLQAAARAAVSIAEHLQGVKMPAALAAKHPWSGAWEHWRREPFNPSGQNTAYE